MCVVSLIANKSGEREGVTEPMVDDETRTQSRGKKNKNLLMRLHAG